MKTVRNLIIVDESGSMCTIRREAFSGMNETLQTIMSLQKESPEIAQTVTLITFDSDHIKFHFNNTPAGEVKLLEWGDYNPSACTPLYDAIGRGINSVFSTCGDEDNVLVTIITDGYENASREFSLTQINNLIEKLKKQGWTFAFIGTDNLDVEGMARDFGVVNSLSFEQSSVGSKAMFDKEIRSRKRWFDKMKKGEMIDCCYDYFAEDETDE